MTDFRAGDPGVDSTKQTSFVDPGVVQPAGSDTDDKTVVLEFGGRPFTKADLVKKLTHAETFIESLKTEATEQRKLLAEVNETLKTRLGAAEVLSQLKQTPAAPTEPAAPSAADPQAIANQVMTAIRQGEAKTQRDANFANVKKTLTLTFGDAVNQKVSQVAAEAGLTLDEAVELAHSKPAVFLRLFPEAKVKSSALPDADRRNSLSFKEQNRGPSGYTKTRSTKDQTQIYLDRLKAMSVE